MARLSFEKKRARQPVGHPAAVPVRVFGGGGASVDGVPVVAAPGEEIQQTVLNHLQRLAISLGAPIRATVHDDVAGCVVPLEVSADGSSRMTGEPVRLTAPETAAARTPAPAPSGRFGPPPVMHPRTPPSPAPSTARDPQPPPTAPNGRSSSAVPGPQTPSAVPGPQAASVAPDGQFPAAVPGQQTPAAVPGGQVPAAVPASRAAASVPQAPSADPASRVPATAPGPQAPSAVPGRQTPAAAPGGQFPAVVSGRQAPVAVSGPQSTSGVPGRQAASAAPAPHTTSALPASQTPVAVPPPFAGAGPRVKAEAAPSGTGAGVRADADLWAAVTAAAPEPPAPGHTPARGFDAVAEEVLGDGPLTETAEGAELLAEPLGRINEAVRAGRIDAAAKLADRTLAEASAVFGPTHAEVLHVRELTAYIAYLGDDPVRACRLSLDLARLRRQARDGDAAYGNVRSAATAWRAVRDPEEGLRLGRDLVGLWADLAAEPGPAADDPRPLEAARARMVRLADRAAAARA